MIAWERFRDDVAEVARVPPEQVTRDAWLIDDLGLDSLSVAEIIAMLAVDYGLDRALDDLERRSWERTTAGDLFEAAAAAG